MRPVSGFLVKRVAFVLASLTITLPAYSQDYQRGLEAYENDNYATAIKEWRPLAEAGNALAQARLGTIYRDGKGIAQEFGRALYWFRRAATQGNASAYSYLGFMYEYGWGVPASLGDAVSHYSKGAELGSSIGQFRLGVMYDRGIGLRQSDHDAFQWYKKAAEQNVIPAMFNLGNMYLRGRGVGQNLPLARMWLDIAFQFGGMAQAGKNRDALERIMTPAQLAEAGRLGLEWLDSQQALSDDAP